MPQLRRFLNVVYMHKRIHSSLGYLTPAEFEEQWRREDDARFGVSEKDKALNRKFYGALP